MCRVAIESQPGDGLYITESFLAREPGQLASTKQFLVGQRVKYLGYEWNPNRLASDTESLYPVWMIRFQSGGVEYRATADYFIHEGAWAGLMKVFGDEVKKNQPAADNNCAGNKFGGVVATVAVLLAISVSIWLVIGVLAALLGK